MVRVVKQVVAASFTRAKPTGHMGWDTARNKSRYRSIHTARRRNGNHTGKSIPPHIYSR